MKSTVERKYRSIKTLMTNSGWRRSEKPLKMIKKGNGAAFDIGFLFGLVLGYYSDQEIS